MRRSARSASLYARSKRAIGNDVRCVGHDSDPVLLWRAGLESCPTDNGLASLAMRYLIDGYNLLYALGLARKNGGRAAWDRARRVLLDWLADQLGPAAPDVTVIFDAQN